MMQRSTPRHVKRYNTPESTIVLPPPKGAIEKDSRNNNLCLPQEQVASTISYNPCSIDMVQAKQIFIRGNHFPYFVV
jgi:hypothetical protein